MQPVNFLLNILWLILGGIWLGIGWYLAGLIMIVTIIGIPWARACFVIGNLAFWPFGKQIVSREFVTGQEDVGTGPLGFIGNILWFIFAGVWLAIGHVTAALANFITIIGIPFAIQHLKLAMIALAPIGKTVIDIDDDVRGQRLF
ncbi:YccF domain-containing protein [Desulfovibrio inopinatus]|uniref:YccF domain-containing protein n=1 Tax=Desulfovibrio inopinatus TaxID=102109 RepID=UPI000414529C|nr:YccF domain-containing protein [Desulfovibrio inopinatus]